MLNSGKNKIILLFSLIISVFAVTVAGISTFAWFQAATAPEFNNSQVQSGSNDLDITGVTGYKYVYDDTGSGIDYNSGHVASYGAGGSHSIENISQDAPGDSRDVPLEGVGFYIKGDETFAHDYGNDKEAWTYASALRMEDKYGANYAYIRGLSFVEDEEIKIWHHYFNNEANTVDAGVNSLNSNIWLTSTSTSDTTSDYLVQAEYNNIKFVTPGVYNIWVINDNGNPKLSFEYASTLSRNHKLDSKNKKVLKATAGASKSNLTQSGFSDYTVESSLGNGERKKWVLRNGANNIVLYNNDEGKNWTNPSVANWSSYSRFLVKRMNTTDGDGSSGSNQREVQNWANYNYIKIDSWDGYYAQTKSRLKVYYVKDGVLDNTVKATYYCWNHDRITESKDSSNNVFNDAPEFTGYNFRGWYTSSTLSTSARINDHYIEADANIYAKFVSSVTITKTNRLFKNDGSSPTSSSGGSDVVDKDSTYGVPGTHDDISGYNFIGWYSDSNCTNSLSSFTANTSKTIYAKFEEINVTITKVGKKIKYDGTSGGADVSFGTESIVKGSQYTPGNPSAVNYYSFSGWYSDSGLNTSISAITPSVYTTIYAKLTEKSYKVTKKGVYLSDGSTNSSKTKRENTSTFDIGVDDAYSDTTYTPATPSAIAGYNFIGWFSSETGNESRSSISHVTGTMTIYAQYMPVSHSITVKKYIKLFDEDGTTPLSDASDYTTLATKYGSSGNYYFQQTSITGYEPTPLTKNSISDLTGNQQYFQKTDSTNNSRYIAKRDGKYYTTASCTTEISSWEVTENLSPISIYAKFVKVPNEDLYIQDNTNSTTYPEESTSLIGNNSYLYGFMSVKEGETDYVYSTNGATSIKLFHKYFRYYHISIPSFGSNDDDLNITITNGSWSSNNNINQTRDIRVNAGATDDASPANTKPQSFPMISIWDKSSASNISNYKINKFSWATYPGNPDTSGYYIVGNEEFTKDADLAWTFNSAMEMTTVNDIDMDDYVIKAQAKSINLVENMQFQIWYFDASSGGITRYNATFLNSEDKETKDYVEDYSNEHNFKVKSEVSGKFNIYFVQFKSTNAYKVMIEDANRVGYMFFTGATGTEGKSTFKMGNGDGTHNLVVYEAGIKIRAGDTFVIRNRVKGKYTFYGNADLYDDEYNFIENDSSKVDDIPINGIGDSDKMNATAIKPIKFTTSGFYSFYLTADGKVVISSISSDPYGYFIIKNPTGASDVVNLDKTTGSAVKMRKLTSDSKNIAVYTGFHVTQDTKYSVFTQYKTSGNNDIITTGSYVYHDFYDGVYAKDNTDKAFSETTSSATINNVNYVTVKAGYYNIYIYNDGYGKRVSFVDTTLSDFFAMNSIPADRLTTNAVYASNTTLIVAVTFECKNVNKVAISVDNVVTGEGTGLHSRLKYGYFLDPTIPSGINPYEYLRENHYGDLKAYSLTTSLGDSSANNGTNATEHTLYIMMDYDPSKISDLSTSSNLVNDFYFVLRTAQA